MSFSKFAATYDDAKRYRLNFSQRFSKMFELLKSEKKTIGIKARYNEDYPQSMSQCMRLDSSIVICDNIHQNWVYKKG